MEDSNPNGGSPKLSLTKLDKENPEGTLGHAAAYGDMGLPVIPNHGKRPLLKEWQNARLSEEEIRSLFADGQNVGLLNGGASGGLVAVDLDAAEAIEIADRFLLRTLRSGREGTPRAHAWYRSPGAKTRKWQDADGAVIVELRSDGCQTLAPTSVHPNGERYRWARDGVEEPSEVAAEELERRCTMLATAAVVARHMPPVGGRHEYGKAVLGFLMRRVGKEAALEMARAAWNAAGADGAEALRDLDGIADDAERRLSEGRNVFGAPALSGMVPGLGDLLVRWWGPDESGRAETDGAAGKEEAPTDDELRDRVLSANPDHGFGLGQWMRYERGAWYPVPKFAVKRRIVATLVAAKPEGIRPTSGRLSSVHELAMIEAAVEDELWDADPDILVCANGAVHVPTGELLPHSPEHYATGAVPYDYDPGAEAPTWERVLREALGAERSRFFQEFAGYAATPDTSLETALWLCGQPGGGRSTLLAGLETMLGPRVGVLGLAEIEATRFALAEAAGKFLLTATEQPAGYMRVSHVLNALISGEPLPVERKFRDPFTLVPRCKLAWASNEMPRLKSASDGLFRRVKVIELDPIPDEERDPEVKERVREEGAGILNWALDGLRRLRRRGGFEIPDSVRAATEEFRLANDVPKMFVEEACIVSDADGCTEQAQGLYAAYRHWCLVNGHKPMSLRSVAGEWRRLGFEPRGRHGRTFYAGVRIDPGWVTAQGDGYPRVR